MNMRRRHPGQMHGGHNGGGGHRRPHGGHQQNRHNGGFQKPGGRNFAASREKYLNMAKDAMSSGDRVLAEYYLQYADHYFRMQQEFLAERAQRYQQQNPTATQAEMSADQAQAESEGSGEAEIGIPNNSNVLPAFLTQPPPQAGDAKPAATGTWEEE